MAVPPPFPSATENKAVLRRRLRAARARHVERLGPAGIAGGNARIAARLAPLLDGVGTIAGYVAHRGEPDILAFLLAAHASGHGIALPRVEGGVMRFVAWRPEMTLAPGIAGIPEPAATPEIPVATLLVPLVGFDRRGHRLGQGAGCYDRWLASHSGRRAIGIAWAMQECGAIPADAWDMPLDVVVTEDEWIAR